MVVSGISMISINSGMSPSPGEMQKEAPARLLLTRVKSANISRHERDRISGMVRNLAEEDRLDNKATKGILDLVYVLEATSRVDRNDTEQRTAERSVEDEMSLISNSRSKKNNIQRTTETLRSSISIMA